MRKDQAHGLRQLFARTTCRVAAVHGQQGARVACELACAIASIGYRVCVLDRTVGAAARAVGRRARYDLVQVLDQHCTLDEALLFGRETVAVLPAARGLERLATESVDWQSALQRAVPALAQSFDLWLVNGLLPGHTAQAPMVLAIDASAPAITNAYGHIKALARAQDRHGFGIIVEAVASAAAAQRVFDCVADTAHRFLAAELDFLGWLPAIDARDCASQPQRRDASVRIADKLMGGLFTAPLLRTGSC